MGKEFISAVFLMGGSIRVEEGWQLEQGAERSRFQQQTGSKDRALEVGHTKTFQSAP